MNTSSIKDQQRPVNILLVEDNPGDVVLTQRALKDSKIANHVMVVKTGEEALAMLRKENGYANLPTPDLIMLDLNLPQMSGQDVLRIIKTDIGLKHIPVVVISSSKAEQDVEMSYRLHANGYLAKPVNLDKFKEMVNIIEQFFFLLVVMPNGETAK